MSDSNADIDEWRLYASCMGLDWTLFFPQRGESVRAAREVCKPCVVKEQCLEDALQRIEPAGVRGGLSARERRTIVRNRRRKLKKLA